MMPFILSVITASLFLGLSSATYGVDAVLSNAWVAMVFWGLLGAGAFVFFLSRQAGR
jgi:hypothetical protein